VNAVTLYVVFLRFSNHKARAGELMASHNAWIARGIADAVFLAVGTLAPGLGEPALGGAVIAHGIDRAALDARLAEDPFVLHDVVEPEVFELSPKKTDPRLAFLLP
jgi:uncharacterized protein YciI